MMIGATIICGNIINGTVLGLNYIAKQKDSIQQEYSIQKIVQHKTGGRKRIRRNNPKVYLEKDGELMRLNLNKRYDASENYSEFKTITLNLSKGWFGFEIINYYELKK